MKYCCFQNFDSDKTIYIQCTCDTVAFVTMGLGENEKKDGNSCQILPGGFAGSGPNGSFFETPGWVDKEKPPGMTSQTEAVAPPGWWIKLVTGYFLFFSPNLVWLTIALIDYFFFPYDYEAAKSLTNLTWVMNR